MTSLRRRMLEDMQVRCLTPATQERYVQAVACFARHFGRSPARLGPEGIRSYQVHLTTERRLAPSSLVVASSALRFLDRVTLKKDWSLDDVIPRAKRRRSLPVVLSPEEVAALLDTVQGVKHRAILTTCYAAGLRMSEALHLTVSAVDSRRMVLHVANSKGAEGPLRDAVAEAAGGAPPRSPSICWKPAPTRARFSSCSATGSRRRSRSTCASRPTRSARPRVRWTGSWGPAPDAPPPTERQTVPRPALSVAEVVRRYGDTFRSQVGTGLATVQRRVMTAIEQCRTKALGGDVEQCDHCAIGASGTTPVATITARPASRWLAPHGWNGVAPTCCPRSTFTSSSPSPGPSP